MGPSWLKPSPIPGVMVSVVVPTRDGEPRIESAIESLVGLDLRGAGLEIVVVSDGSRDRTVSVAQDLLERLWPRGRRNVLDMPPRGLNAARNVGIDASCGDLIAFVDDDELVPKMWLQELIGAADRHPRAGCVGGPMRTLYRGRLPRTCPHCVPSDAEHWQGTDEIEVDRVAGGNMMLRRAAIDEVGTFNEALSGWGDESEWMRRLRGSGREVIYAPAACLYQRRDASDMRSLALIKKSFKRGREEMRYRRLIGEPTQRSADALWAARNIGHSIRHRCTMGFVVAAGAGGRLVESVFDA
jgi:glycosyltransferase involved in cell wall biosynthesis